MDSTLVGAPHIARYDEWCGQGLVYFTPVAGGLIADQFLGQYTAVLVGGVLMAAGHLCMVFEEWFILAVGLLILGNGLFKPNIRCSAGLACCAALCAVYPCSSCLTADRTFVCSTQVGRLYEENDPKRDQVCGL